MQGIFTYNLVEFYGRCRYVNMPTDAMFFQFFSQITVTKKSNVTVDHFPGSFPKVGSRISLTCSSSLTHHQFPMLYHDAGMVS